ncbi:ribokinase [Filomicrobium insigne]|uniref:Ribokinase n=1 Tax=Filomicrobium insigne TaxID=418854 RepID=A0A1H0Q1S4_9HYPH|nr:ribokinase [Filomicrobium insigne]SDP11391.1 ribokinase [Filomicrobium insigne]
MTILVVGNCVVDRSYKVDRLPRPGETMIAREARIDFGGKGLNQAVSAARTGAPVAFATAVGDDVYGREIVDLLRRETIDVGPTHIRPGPTDEAAIFVLPDGDNSIIASTHSAQHAGPDIGLKAMDRLKPGDWLVMQGNIDRATTAATLEAARAKNARIAVNPSPILFDYEGLWPLIDLAFVNAIELADLSGLSEPNAAAARLIELGCDTVVATLGSAGARLYARGRSEPWTAQPPAVKAIDATGAGDAFCGVFVGSLARGLSPEAALSVGVHCASLSVTRQGSLAALPTREEISATAREFATTPG